LCSDLASGITGQVLYVDAGYEIMGMWCRDWGLGKESNLPHSLAR
jgi:hypothetical protein